MKSRLVDTHCHLYFNLFDDDLPDVIRRAVDRGVNNIMVPGLDLATSYRAIALCDSFPNVYAAVGIHPNEANGWGTGALNEITSMANHPKVLAIGEIGLDFYRNYTPVDLQERALKDQLDLADTLRKPVILHCRAATPRLLAILNERITQHANEAAGTVTGVLHAFEGSLEEALLAVEYKFLIGIGGPVTYKNARDKQILAKELPLSSIVLETDAPFLTPHPFRGQRNEPARIFEIANKIAIIRGCTFDIISENTSRNADLLFGWSFSR